MMRRRSVPAMFVAALVIGCLGVFAHADQAELYSLMIQQSPVDAGLVTPEVGIHRIPMGDQVMLQAVARPGFRFLYWLGDVSDSSTDQAVVVIDAPKIVVAVYGRLEHELVIGGGGSAEADSRADRTGGLGDIDAPSVGGASSLTASAGFTGGGRGGSSARPGGKLRSIPSASGGTGGGD
ncbi:MAG: hypothetical protein IH624_05645, partial [Phycisphaerae bacterium]|nr:hypothetical protein [Phycisphaerae bacterium]